MPIRRIAVAMSGGVDSSVATAILAQQGHDVFGIMMRLWSASPDGSNRCCSPEDVTHARQVAAMLQIPFYVIDAQEPFQRHVVRPFINAYAQGITPNPCLSCNRHLRWDFLLQQVFALGASHLATGHYARIHHDGNRYRLLRARDQTKDQSYVLSVLGQDQLSHSIFPIGESTKAEVRQFARRFKLPVSERPDSQDLCFVSDQADYRTFLRSQHVTLPPPGPITDLQGNIIGQHQGLADYTIGQRKGIGISAPHPLYVLEKDLATNTLVVGPKPTSTQTSFFVDQVNWTCGRQPSQAIKADTRIRYHAPEAPADIVPLSSLRVEVKPLAPIRNVTPGQAAVFYQGEECIGGGIIQP